MPAQAGIQSRAAALATLEPLPELGPSQAIPEIRGVVEKEIPTRVLGLPLISSPVAPARR
jgi:hypothetical protein